MTGPTEAREDVARDLFIESRPAAALEEALGVVGELGPGAEVVVGAALVDQSDEAERDALVDRMVDRDLCLVGFRLPRRSRSFSP
jgi:hypothetical protein